MIALSTGSLYTYGTERVFALAAKVGFDAVEILIDQRWDTRQPDYLSRLRDRYSLPIASVHAPFLPGIPGWPDSGVASCQRAAALAEAVGARTVVMHLPLSMSFVRLTWSHQALTLPVPITPDAEHVRWLRHGLESFQKSTPVTIAVEILPRRRLWFGGVQSVWHNNTPDHWARLAHVALDTTHIGTWGFDLLAVYERLQPRVAHIHLSNYNGREKRPEHRLLTDGSLPLAGLLQRLARDRFGGVIVCELDPEPLGAENEDVALANLRATLAFCRDNWRAGMNGRA